LERYVDLLESNRGIGCKVGVFGLVV
jgi:cyclin G-associated kinase